MVVRVVCWSKACGIEKDSETRGERRTAVVGVDLELLLRHFTEDD
jgi:hypothetical protein